MSSLRPARILLRLRELAQLFNSMDPSPFLDRDLDGDAEEFILSWARELPAGQPFELDIHLANSPPPDRIAGVEEAVQHYFANRTLMKQREFQQLMRRGRLSLIVGLLFLALCLSLGQVAGRLGKNASADFIEASLTIVGWVAMWRPLEIYLYDWWPLRAERQVLARLARVKVKLVLPNLASAPSVPKAAPP